MSADRSRQAAARPGGQQSTWLDKLSQALLREPKDRQQLTDLLREAEQRNILDPEALSMIEGVLEVSEMQVRDIMIPRAQMIVVGQEASLGEIQPTVIESAHSRFPVVGDSRDEVVGILLAKDLLAMVAEHDYAKMNTRDNLRPAVFIPESKRLNVLLNEFRANRNHMAIVVDEYGGVAGLITIEDVIEQIVGDIEDEHDISDDVFILRHSSTRYTAKALTPIKDINGYFNADFSDGEFDTIGGLMTKSFGYLPQRGELIDIGLFQFKVLKADSRRVHLIQITLLDTDEGGEGPASTAG